MMKQHQFRRLVVWQRSMTFVTRVYAITTTFPKAELFGLVDQIRRAAVSISLNIAEGSGSSTNQEFLRFLAIAKRSAYEVITGFEIAKALHYGTNTQIDALVVEAEEICSMIVGLSKSIKS